MSTGSLASLSSPDHSRFAPFALDHTRLARPKTQPEACPQAIINNAICSKEHVFTMCFYVHCFIEWKLSIRLESILCRNRGFAAGVLWDVALARSMRHQHKVWINLFYMLLLFRSSQNNTWLSWDLTHSSFRLPHHRILGFGKVNSFWFFQHLGEHST